MADYQEPTTTRRYQLRTRTSKNALEDSTTNTTKAAQSKSTSTQAPPPTRPARQQLTAGTVTTTVKVKPPADEGPTQSTSTTNAAPAPVRPTRRPSQKNNRNAASAAAASAEPKATAIPVPTRATRSGRVVATGPTTITNQRKSTSGQRANGRAAVPAAGDRAQHAGDGERGNVDGPSLGNGNAGGGKRVTFQDDKENLFPASEKEAEMKQQEMTEEDRSSNPFLGQPVRSTTAAGPSSFGVAGVGPSSPTKAPIRPSISSKLALPSPIRAPPPRRPTSSTLGSVAPKQLFNDDSPDELACPMSPSVLASPARRPQATRLPPPVKADGSSGNLLASPPRRPVKRDPRLQPVSMSFDQPPQQAPAQTQAPLHSPAKRNVGMKSPVKNQAPALGLLSSPAKRPNLNRGLAQIKKAAEMDAEEEETEEEDSVDELSLQTYSISHTPMPGVPSRLGAFMEMEGEEEKGEGEARELAGMKLTSAALKQLNPQSTSTPPTASIKRDTDGDTEMTDADMDDDLGETPPSPCPTHNFQSKAHGGYAFSPSGGHWGLDSSSPTAETSPLVNGLEGLGLEASRKSLFPKRVPGGGSSTALEKSMELDSGVFDRSSVMGGIPIDPMLLEGGGNDENDVEMATAPLVRVGASVPVNFGDELDGEIDAEGEIDEDLLNAQGMMMRAPLSSTYSAPPPVKMKKEKTSPATAVTNGILAGAVVFVDVYTTDGADASGVLVQLLHTLGAKTVKRWDWNPAKGDAKVGITHVVFKDGSARTLEKVRKSGGVVLCVGAAWIVECDKAQKWVDEGLFSVDLTFIPRGGHRVSGPSPLQPIILNVASADHRPHQRRKSMEPKQATRQTTSTTSTTASPAKRSPRQFEVAVDGQPLLNHPQSAPPAAPLPPPSPEDDEEDEEEEEEEVDVDHTMAMDDDGMADNQQPGTWGSLTPAPLPPQYHSTPPRAPVNRLGFYVDDHNSGLMEKLLLARRKSMQFAPKVGSPLGKTCMWAD